MTVALSPVLLPVSNSRISRNVVAGNGVASSVLFASALEKGADDVKLNFASET